MENTDTVYTVKLADGTELTDLKLNGNNFISAAPIEKSIFENNCSSVVISDGENEEKYTNMDLIHLTKTGDEYWFALRELTSAELETIKIKSDIEYIALMTDVEL